MNKRQTPTCLYLLLVRKSSWYLSLSPCLMHPIIARSKLTGGWWRAWSNGTLVLNFTDARIVNLPPKLEPYCSQLLWHSLEKDAKVSFSSTKDTKITIIFWSKWSSLNSPCYIFIGFAWPGLGSRQSSRGGFCDKGLQLPLHPTEPMPAPGQSHHQPRLGETPCDIW